MDRCVLDKLVSAPVPGLIALLSYETVWMGVVQTYGPVHKVSSREWAAPHPHEGRGQEVEGFYQGQESRVCLIGHHLTCALIHTSPHFPLPICWSPVKGSIYVILETAYIITFSAMLALKTTVQCPHFFNFTISQYVWAGSFPTYLIDPFHYPNSLIISLVIHKVVAAHSSNIEADHKPTASWNKECNLNNTCCEA